MKNWHVSPFCIVCLPLILQASGQPSELVPGDPITELDPLVVTASPLKRTQFELAQATKVVDSRELLLKSQATLGETLNNEPGVSSTYFGPGASRPIIRGLGDDRVRVLQNGTSVLDVSNVSPDHAVAVDPLSLKSVEIVRGPAVLLYGPNTMGGVINATDDRIPEEKFTGKWPEGHYATNYSSVDDGYSHSGEITFGAGPLVFHIDGFTRETQDVHIPGYARSEILRATTPLPPDEVEAYGVLPNSATESRGAGLGGSYVWDGGFFGASFSGVDSHYGTVAERDVTIGLHQRRWDFRGAFYDPVSGIKEIRYKFGHSDYNHTEFEGSEPGTQFLIRGYDGRVEVVHKKLGPFEGSVGFETQDNHFSALGDEAFLPHVENKVNSGFVFEEVPLADNVKLQFGARYDHQTNDTEPDQHFGPGIDREFNAYSTSAGIVYNPAKDYALALTLGYTQRPPTYVELFADGPHVATGTVEVGDSNLSTEDAFSIDLSLRKKAGFVTGSVSGFYYRFDRFISLTPTGTVDPGENLPVYAYRGVPADFAGGEAEAVFHLIEGDSKPAEDGKSGIPKATGTSSQDLDLTLRADYVHAENRDTGEPIPRIPPFRTSAGLDYRYNRFGAQLEGSYNARQDRTAAHELPTDGYFLLNAGVSYDFDVKSVKTTLYLKGTNLTNEEARESTSFLKDISPLAGRGVVVGLRTDF
jgi:iron complex outermembrane receptor protein